MACPARLPRFAVFRRTGGVVVAALVAVATGPGDIVGAPDPAPTTFTADVRPVLESTCVACHDGRTKAGGLDLVGFADGTRVRERLDVWRRIRARVAAREMPPKDAAKPSVEAKARFLAAIDRAITAATPPAIPGDPGRVTLRRLNRLEYRNTIRDLLGVDDRSSDGFPSDDVGYGFDRIGDVLSMPPLLLEKYAQAAERIAAAAIVDAGAGRVPTKRFEAEQLDLSRESASVGGGFVNFFANGTATGEVRLSRDGPYEIRARVFADQAGTDLARLAWRVGDVEVPGTEVRAARRAPETVVGTFRGTAGLRTFSIAFVNDYYDPTNADPARRDRNLHVDWVEIAGPMGIVDDPPASHRRIFAGDPGAAVRDPRVRAAAILRPLASRAWRRPVAARRARCRSSARVTDEVKAGASFERGVQSRPRGDPRLAALPLPRRGARPARRLPRDRAPRRLRARGAPLVLPLEQPARRRARRARARGDAPGARSPPRCAGCSPTRGRDRWSTASPSSG